MAYIHHLRIMLADDHELYLDGLKGLFSNQQRYKIVGTAGNGKELIQLAESLRPQILLTDLRMPLVDGTSAIRKLKQKIPAMQCLVLTGYDNENYLLDALEAGAIGYINKQMPKELLFEAIEQASHGRPYFCNTTSAKMLRLISKSPYNPFSKEEGITFGPTEKNIIQLLCEDLNTHEIADRLFLSRRTVENNRSKIMRKMEVRSSVGVAVYAIKHGLYWFEKEE